MLSEEELMRLAAHVGNIASFFVFFLLLLNAELDVIIFSRYSGKPAETAFWNKNFDSFIIHPVYTSCGPVPSLTLDVMSAHSASQEADSRRKFSEMVDNPPEGEAKKLPSLMRSWKERVPLLAWQNGRHGRGAGRVPTRDWAVLIGLTQGWRECRTY